MPRIEDVGDGRDEAMIDFVHHEEAVALAAVLGHAARDVPRSSLHWISTPNGTHETNSGYFWCRDCGLYVVRHLRRKDRRHASDYLLDGGWGTEEESLPRCVGCGVHLSVTLLKYGVLDELDFYRERNFAESDGDPSEDAYCLCEVLEAVAVTSQSDVWMAAEAIEIARRFIAVSTASKLLAPPMPEPQELQALTKAQAKALAAAADDCGGVAGSEWYQSGWLGERQTVRALNRMGLLETNTDASANLLYRLTDAGRRALSQTTPEER